MLVLSCLRRTARKITPDASAPSDIAARLIYQSECPPFLDWFFYCNAIRAAVGTAGTGTGLLVDLLNLPETALMLSMVIPPLRTCCQTSHSRIR
jgi:hypothetical protein